MWNVNAGKFPALVHLYRSLLYSGRFPGSLSYIRGLSANKVLPDLIGSCSNFKTVGNPYVGVNKSCIYRLALFEKLLTS